MADSLSRAQRRIVADIMAGVQTDGFVIAGGIAMLAAGVSDRPTLGLEALSPTCDDVGHTADRLAGHLRDSDYLVDLHHSDVAFASMTVSTGKYRRTALAVGLERRAQQFASVDHAVGPMLSIRELAADTVLAAYGRREPRDLVDLHSLADATSLQQAVADAQAKDADLTHELFVEMVDQTVTVRDDLWPKGSDPDSVRAFASETLLDPTLFASD